MKTYKFNYIVKSERVAYIYADSESGAKDKIEDIMRDNIESVAIEKIEDKYVETVKESGLGVNFNSFCEVEDIDEEEF